MWHWEGVFGSGAAWPVASSLPSDYSLPLLITTLLVQFPLMFVFPILLGWWLRRRYGIGWGIFGAGALTFVASQVVHLPLNWALGLLGGGRGVALWPLVPMALVAGLSAGICEEGARWLALRFFVKRARGWSAALQFGAGHGGIEAILLGALVAVNFLAMLLLPTLGLERLGLPAEAAEQVQAAATAYWQSPWYLPVLSGLERVAAITVQVAMAVLVMRAVVRRQPAYLVAAIAAHAAVDAAAVLGMAKVGPVWTEVIVWALALLAFWLILRLKEMPPAPAEPGGALPAPGAGAPSLRMPAGDAVDLSAEELERRIEASRYE